MANSKYEYVKGFETNNVPLLPNVWLVVRIDGQGFTKFTKKHNFKKPNDKRALDLMNKCAITVMKSMPDIKMAYGESDEYSFVISKDSEMHNRRESKLVSLIASQFSSSYVFFWNKYFPDQKLEMIPAFDARVVIYPSDQNLRDYLSWRQADCHINNLYNTCFWNLVNRGGVSEREAENQLCASIYKGTFSSDKNELLFSKFGINYNNEPEIFKKGSVLVYEKYEVDRTSKDGEPIKRTKRDIFVRHCDLIRDDFWNKHPDILGTKKLIENEEERVDEINRE